MGSGPRFMRIAGLSSQREVRKTFLSRFFLYFFEKKEKNVAGGSLLYGEDDLHPKDGEVPLVSFCPTNDPEVQSNAHFLFIVVEVRTLPGRKAFLSTSSVWSREARCDRLTRRSSSRASVELYRPSTSNCRCLWILILVP